MCSSSDMQMKTTVDTRPTMAAAREARVLGMETEWAAIAHTKANWRAASTAKVTCEEEKKSRLVGKRVRSW